MFRIAIRKLVLATMFSMVTLFSANSSKAGWWHHSWWGCACWYGYPHATMYYPVYTPIIGWDWCCDPCAGWYDCDLGCTVADGCDTWTADACCDGVASSSTVHETSPAPDSAAPGAPAVAEPKPAAPKHADSVLQNKPVVPAPSVDDAPKPPVVPPPPAPLESTPEPTPAPPAKEPPSKVTRGAPADGTLLTVHVPSDARVYINGRLTKTPGAQRQYLSRGLLPGCGYGYEVRAVIERDGRQLTDTQVVRVHAGEAAQLAFRFDRPAPAAVQTTVTLHVPQDARVTLAGHATWATGAVRRFRTTDLPQGTRWEDYRIEVAVNRDGQWVTREKTITLTGGDSVTLDFGVDADQVARR